ncbi:MAG TPA: hypothetical protein VET89_10195 [Stellaceae bacterium]|jgi:hypothetical protein|nr:hypothetical protein [Stellaceae bacterium]
MDGEETPAEREMPLWWQRAERMRREKEQRLRQEAARRLRRIEAEARARLAAELKPLADFTGIVDSDRLAAPFLERIGTRGRVQLVLWAGMSVAGACAIVSFFTAPLMGLGTAMSSVLVGTMLILAYVM